MAIRTDAPMTEAEQRAADLPAYIEWLKTVPNDQLHRLLADAFWKGHSGGSELERFFLLHKKGVNMLDRPAK